MATGRLLKPRTPTVLVAAGVVALAALAAVSVTIGVADLDAFVLVESRIPRTLALVLAGSSFAVIGLIMQLLTRNRLVEPGTTGATDAAMLALLIVLLTAPDLPIWAKTCLASTGALVGVLGFLALARRIPFRSSALVPVVGILYSAVIGSVAAFIAYRTDTLQELLNWSIGDFSGILRGRYEMLFVAAAAALMAWIAADRFLVASLGDDTARGLGLDTRGVMALGVGVIAVVTGAMTVVTGALPFLGLIVPNIVSRLVGDNMRRTVPLVALMGAVLVLGCDIIGRTVRFPFELPISLIMGIIGGVVFLRLIVGRPRTARSRLASRRDREVVGS